MASANLNGLASIGLRLDGIARPPRAAWERLAEGLERVIVEDNRKGVLEGTDAMGRPAPTLKYRDGFGAKTKARGLRSSLFGTTAKRFKGKTDYAFQNRILPNNNLSTAMYRDLDGPYAAPRKEASRVITNLVALDPVIDADSVLARCGWMDVLDPKGRHFLPGLFRRYELRGVRPWGIRKARELARLWAESVIRGDFT
jgi:hypothetical protein